MSDSRYYILIAFVLIAPNVQAGLALSLAVLYLVFAVIAAIKEGRQK